MLEFEKKYNKKCEEKNKEIVCFGCNKEGHSIEVCYKLFPKKKEGGEQQDRSYRLRRDDTQRNKKEKAMKAESNFDMDYNSGEKFNSKSENEEVVNLALVAMHDSETSFSSTNKETQKLNLDSVECNNNLVNMCDSTSEFMSEDSTKGSIGESCVKSRLRIYCRT